MTDKFDLNAKLIGSNAAPQATDKTDLTQPDDRETPQTYATAQPMSVREWYSEYEGKVRTNADLVIMLEAYNAYCAASLLQQLAALEKSESQLVDERDFAEEVISQAYFLITGRSPEWSNLFGYPQALDEIDDAQRLLRQQLAAKDAIIKQLEGAVRGFESSSNTNHFRAEHAEAEVARLREALQEIADTPIEVFVAGDRFAEGEEWGINTCRKSALAALAKEGK